MQEQMFHLFTEILDQLVQFSLVAAAVAVEVIILVQGLYKVLTLVLVELVVVEQEQEILRLLELPVQQILVAAAVAETICKK